MQSMPMAWSIWPRYTPIQALRSCDVLQLLHDSPAVFGDAKLSDILPILLPQTLPTVAWVVIVRFDLAYKQCAGSGCKQDHPAYICAAKSLSSKQIQTRASDAAHQNIARRLQQGAATPGAVRTVPPLAHPANQVISWWYIQSLCREICSGNPCLKHCRPLCLLLSQCFYKLYRSQRTDLLCLIVQLC